MIGGYLLYAVLGIYALLAATVRGGKVSWAIGRQRGHQRDDFSFFVSSSLAISIACSREAVRNRG